MTCSNVVAKYGREVLGRVRVDQANRLRHDHSTRRVLKSTRWLLLRNPQNQSAPQEVHPLPAVVKHGGDQQHD
ncbi:hypothetical protein CBM2634_P100032 [Cupriavidus taiwanensis]|uniref:Transposase n=1 Tax=Cupriavidus taiwanensis TaxID=164546 RepID=A0A375JEV8_9BURK|nr:hypothetical protein CBM2634_P100032 [Cupriavidus taiwanensis]